MRYLKRLKKKLKNKTLSGDNGDEIQDMLLDNYDEINKSINNDSEIRNIYNEKKLSKELNKIKKITTENSKYKLIDTRRLAKI